MRFSLLPIQGKHSLAAWHLGGVVYKSYFCAGKQVSGRALIQVWNMLGRKRYSVKKVKSDVGLSLPDVQADWWSNLVDYETAGAFQ